MQKQWRWLKVQSLWKNDCYGSIYQKNHQKVFLAAPVTQKLVKPILFEWDLAYSQVVESGATEWVKKKKKKSSRQPKTIIVTPTFKRGEKRDRHSLLSEHSTLGECEIPEEKTA